MTITTILCILLAHFIGDFILQTRWMAMNKSKDNAILATHVTIYSFCLLPFGPVYALVNGLLHFATDFVSSRLTTHFWNKKDTHKFFVILGADQMLHSAALFATYKTFAGW